MDLLLISQPNKACLGNRTALIGSTGHKLFGDPRWTLEENKKGKPTGISSSAQPTCLGGEMGANNEAQLGGLGTHVAAGILSIG